jgi:hypothetical protein
LGGLLLTLKKYQHFIGRTITDAKEISTFYWEDYH